MNSYQLFKVTEFGLQVNLKYFIMINSYIKSISFHVPEKIITNNDLAKVMDTSDELIRTRTGIEQRHTVGDRCLGPADLAAIAAKKTLLIMLTPRILKPINEANPTT